MRSKSGSGEPHPSNKKNSKSIQEKGEHVPESAFATMGGAKEWLDLYMSSRGPSDKQVQPALNLSTSTGKEYTDSMRMSAVLTKMTMPWHTLKRITFELVVELKNQLVKKQVEMAKKLAKEQNVEWNPELKSMTAISQFIDDRMKNRAPREGGGGGGGADRPATETNCHGRRSGKAIRIDYPASHKKSMKKTSEFIDKHFKK